MIPRTMSKIIITGTDTEIGKTCFCAALMLGLDAAGLTPHYWKPIQSGMTDGTDTRTVQQLVDFPDERFLDECYIFKTPLSPHRSAEIDGQRIDVDALCNPLNIPSCDGPLIIEGAGGVMVPLTRDSLQVELYQKWDIPVVLCARTGLGTINHVILSVEALRRRGVPFKGLVFIGEANPDNVKTAADFCDAKVLGVFPTLSPLTTQTLRNAFRDNFDTQDFVS